MSTDRKASVHETALLAEAFVQTAKHGSEFQVGIMALALALGESVATICKSLDSQPKLKDDLLLLVVDTLSRGAALNGLDVDFLVRRRGK